MEACACDIAFLASRAGTASDRPCLVVPVEEEGALQIGNYLVEFIDILISLADMTVEENGILVRIEYLPHLIRFGRAGRAAETLVVHEAAELASHPYPVFGKYL